MPTPAAAIASGAETSPAQATIAIAAVINAIRFVLNFTSARTFLIWFYCGESFRLSRAWLLPKWWLWFRWRKRLLPHPPTPSSWCRK
jgi:hypothetical protein